jgi:hypothetical protein
MTSYIPGSGLKKPLNQLEAPAYPDIKQGPPRFVWSRKHWKVDAGATVRDTEAFTQFQEPAILAQSRDYNKTVYGQSSHKDIVNAAFRPPILDPYEDFYPLTRIPATTRAIIPHINPSTVSDGGTSGYISKNERVSGIESALTDRISGGEWRPTFFAPIEIPQDNSVLPDLEAKLPPTSVFAGWNMPTNLKPPEDCGWQSLDKMITDSYDVPLDAGSTYISLDGPTGKENIDLRYNRPQVSAGSGQTTKVTFDGELPMPVLSQKRPSVSASSGVNTPVLLDGEIPTEYQLSYNRPQASASAGMNTPLNIDSHTPLEDIHLTSHLGSVPVSVLNPGSETGYKGQVEMYTPLDNYIQVKNPSYSYMVPQEVPIYRDRNNLSQKPQFRGKLQPQKSYGQISQSGSSMGHLARNYVEHNSVPMNGSIKFSNQRKKPVYRI